MDIQDKLMNALTKDAIVSEELIKKTPSYLFRQIQKNGETFLTHYLKTHFNALPYVVRLLCSQGSDVNQPNVQSQYPLKLALNRNHKMYQTLSSYSNNCRYSGCFSDAQRRLTMFDCSYELVSFGAETSNIFINDLTFWGHKITTIRSLEEIQKLSSCIKTVPTNNLLYADNKGNTPLHLLLTQDDNLLISYMLNLLIEKTNINAQNNNKETPLTVGIKSNIVSQEHLLKIIHSGADVNIADNTGNTPLHYLVQKPEMDRVLLSVLSKSHLQAKNNAGKTPIDLAKTATIKALLFLLSNISNKERQKYYQHTQRFISHHTSPDSSQQNYCKQKGN